jgi:hypothetical protein
MPVRPRLGSGVPELTAPPGMQHVLTAIAVNIERQRSWRAVS